MDKLLIIIIGAAAVAGLLVVAAILGTTFGAIAGWIVGWVFDETMTKMLTTLGIEHIAMWELGAMLGFVGSFVRGSSSSSSS